jgi:predicted small metal-binding protein
MTRDVAERAGNSAEVIQRVFGHRTHGRDQIDERRADALMPEHPSGRLNKA